MIFSYTALTRGKSAMLFKKTRRESMTSLLSKKDCRPTDDLDDVFQLRSAVMQHFLEVPDTLTDNQGRINISWSHEKLSRGELLDIPIYHFAAAINGSLA